MTPMTRILDGLQNAQWMWMDYVAAIVDAIVEVRNEHKKGRL